MCSIPTDVLHGVVADQLQISQKGKKCLALHFLDYSYESGLSVNELVGGVFAFTLSEWAIKVSEQRDSRMSVSMHSVLHVCLLGSGGLVMMLWDVLQLWRYL